jgi:hypothetical protein
MRPTRMTSSSLTAGWRSSPSVRVPPVAELSVPFFWGLRAATLPRCSRGAVGMRSVPSEAGAVARASPILLDRYPRPVSTHAARRMPTPGYAQGASRSLDSAGVVQSANRSSWKKDPSPRQGFGSWDICMRSSATEKPGGEATRASRHAVGLVTLSRSAELSGPAVKRDRPRSVSSASCGAFGGSPGPYRGVSREVPSLRGF